MAAYTAKPGRADSAISAIPAVDEGTSLSGCVSSA